MWLYIVIYLFICSIETETIANNNTVVITKYAKVARWGLNDNKTDLETEQGRSNNYRVGPAHKMKGSNVNIVRSIRPDVVYQYPVYRRPSSKVDYGGVPKIPAIGEVIQERFNAKPYFGYGQIPPKNQESATYGPPKLPVTQANPRPASINPSTTFDSFPAVFNMVPTTEKSPVDLYTSPFSSYNPPNQKENGDFDSYPPLNQDSYAAPVPFSGQGEYNYKPPDNSKIHTATLGPPFQNVGDNKGVDINPGSPNEDDMYDHSHGLSSMMMMNQPKAPKTADGPPNYPPKSIDDVYDPSEMSSGHNLMMDHFKTQMSSPQSADDIYYPPDFGKGGNDLMMNQQKPPMASPQADMTYDLSPPISNTHGEHFPQYLYDSHHFDHHIYEEIPHVTTTQAPEKRVSKSHYSYYYLGRKLWYIPLYFCIYFIIYVAILIIKAIARHKVQFKYDWISAHSRSARKLNGKNSTIDDIHRNVTTGLQRANKMYSHIAM